MISKLLRIFIWVSLALFACYSAEIPKECNLGSPDYNETLCNETCTKKIHANESYCSNFTQSTASVQNQPQQQQEAADPIAASGIVSPTSRDKIPTEVTTPMIDFDIKGSAVSPGLSLKGCAIASFCVLLFAYF